MARLYTQQYFGNRKEILAIPDHYVAVGFDHPQASSGNEGLSVLEDGRYIVRAGTIYPSNGANAIGVVLNDVDVTDGDGSLAVVIHGFIKVAAIPALPSANALAKLKNIEFLPLAASRESILCEAPAIIDAGAQDVEGTQVVVELVGAYWRSAATTLTNWTFTGEATTKVDVDSIEINGRFAIITLDQSAAAVVGTITAIPDAACISTGYATTNTVTIVKVEA